MKKVVLSLLIVAVACTTLFAAGTAEQQKDVTIRMWTFIDPQGSGGRNVALKQMIDEFESENPGVRVVVEPKTHTTMTAEFLAAAATGAAPDIMWCSSALLFGCIEGGLLEPLENLFLGDWSAEEVADVDDAFFKFGEKNGKHYTLSLSKNAVCLYYRSDVLANAGCTIPTTWEELYQVAKATTDPAAGRYGLGMAVGNTGDYPLISNYILDKQGTLFNEDGTARFATEAGVEAINYVKRFFDEGLIAPDCMNKVSDDMMLEFQSGKYAMIPCGFVRIGTFKAQSSYDPRTIKVCPVPTGSWIDGWHVGIWSGSKNKEWAGKFLEKMYTTESDLLWVNRGAQAPVRKSTSQYVTITEDNDYILVAGNIFETGYNVPNDRSYDQLKQELNLALQRVLVDGMDPMASLKQAETAFNKANNR